MREMYSMVVVSLSWVKYITGKVWVWGEFTQVVVDVVVVLRVVAKRWSAFDVVYDEDSRVLHIYIYIYL